MSESLNYIEAYFTGQLSDTEKRQFEQKCEADQEFAGDVAFYITSRQAIREKLLDEKRLLWAAAEARPQEITAVPTIGKRIMLNRWVAYAAAACVVIAVAFYFLNAPDSPKQLADKYIKENYNRLPQTMDGATDSLQMGIAIYNKKDYEKALGYFQNIYAAHPENSDAKMYTGIVYLKQKKYENAIAQFDSLSVMTLESNRGVFLKAVTLLERNQGNDRQQARSLLEQVVKQSLDGSMQAREWLQNGKWE